MRVLVLFVPLLLAGCISLSSEDLGKLPDYATGGMYTTIAPAAVSACIAQAIDGTSEPDSGGYRVMSRRRTDLAYFVGSNPRPGIYHTQVTVLNATHDTADGLKASSCLVQLEAPQPIVASGTR